MADTVAPAAPAAPSAPAPAAPAPAAPAAAAPAPVAPAAPAPAAPAGGGDPAAPAAPAAAVPAAAEPAAPAKFDPKTSLVPPKASDFPQNAQGNMDFMEANASWGIEHPEEAAAARAERARAAEGGEEGATTAEEANAAAVAAVEGEEPKPGEDVKPGETVAAATPATIEEWTTASPELKAAFDKSPKLREEIMGMARENEAARPILDIVSTKEEAQFAVEHAQALVSLQANWMLAGEDPEMVGSAWDQVVDLFTERAADGTVAKNADGKPVVGADFKPFVRKAASAAMEDYSTSAQQQITALESRLTGVYATEAAKEADATALENAKYEKAAFDFVMGRLAKGDEGSALPALPPNATPEQVEFQKRLEAQQKELDAKQGKQTAESRKANRAKLDGEVQVAYEGVVNNTINAHLEAMKARGEYLPKFVLEDKWVNPQTGQPTKLADFNAKVYLELNQKINSNPLHVAKLGSLQALGAAGLEQRKQEMTRLTGMYLQKIIDKHVDRIQNGIRESQGQGKPDPTVPPLARVEPQSAGTTTPQPQNNADLRKWAEGEAKKDPNWAAMGERDREVLVSDTFAKKKYGA